MTVPPPTDPFEGDDAVTDPTESGRTVADGDGGARSGSNESHGPSGDESGGDSGEGGGGRSAGDSGDSGGESSGDSSESGESGESGGGSSSESGDGSSDDSGEGGGESSGEGWLGGDEKSVGDRVRSAFGLSAERLVELFEGGDMEIEGRMPYSSNATFLVVVSDDGASHRAIYKPGRGERPLWDFPPDLYKREVATYRLAEALGWDVVPPTVIASGPHGEGSVQAFVNGDHSEHYFTMLEEGIGLDDLRRLCALDLISNNTDRKSGHCLLGYDGRVYGIDHGLSFHAQFKLRTVMWDFVDEPVPADILASIERFLDDGPPVELICLLDALETDAMLSRARALLRAGVFPDDDTGGHRYPWPLV